MENYLNQNYKLFTKVVDTLVMMQPVKDTELHKQYLWKSVHPYLQDLEAMEQLTFNGHLFPAGSPLWKHKFFMELCIKLVDEYKVLKDDLFVDMKTTAFNKQLAEMIGDWNTNETQQLFYIEKTKYYGKKAWEDDTIVGTKKVLDRKKDEAFAVLSQKKNGLNF